ncbi:septum formation initiator family protein [Kibdelosporangium philippinense]|uniref:Septum formation initiator family protein n=1 Tax=Kibdelosporangium philippinense TaxID=211113 RepID=A0ABS8ZLJ1_9PSEU|nr:septum formation initiator family protein [Kibdelosporangium philippinense]MCE7008663.1 septum formation initiator family protein [Kibdelosporangium philippinense]
MADEPADVPPRPERSASRRGRFARGFARSTKSDKSGTPDKPDGAERPGRRARPGRRSETTDKTEKTDKAETPEQPQRRRPAPKPRPKQRSRFAARLMSQATTRRAAVLATVVAALALSVAVPLRTYLSQRDEVGTQERRQAELAAQVQQLEERKAQLSDPAQIQAEARRRLRYVMPGETPYMVQLPGDAGVQPGQQPATPSGPQQPWFQSLWDSIKESR